MAKETKQPGLEDGYKPGSKPNPSEDGSGDVKASEVSAARGKAANTTEVVKDAAIAATVSSLESDISGTSGEQGKVVHTRVSKARGVSARALIKAAHFPTGPDTERFDHASDLDKYEKNAELLDQAAGRISAEVLREATKGTEITDTGTFGDPSMASVYSDESSSAVEEVLGTGVYAPIGHPRSRKSGTFLLGNSGVGMSNLDKLYSYCDADGIILSGHDRIKNELDQENLLFNRLAENGRFTETPTFVMPKKGKFLILGMNPQRPSTLETIGYVNRTSSDGETHRYPVQGSRSNGLFEVVDITPTVTDLKSVANSIKQYVVANEGKFEEGMYESMAQSLMDAEQALLEPERINPWPEFSKSARSTLKQANDIRGSRHNYNCYNDTGVYAQFMSKVEHSEVIYAGARFAASPTKILDTMKFHLGQEGRSGQNTYFNEIMKGNLEYTAQNGAGVTNSQLPGIARYAQTQVSPRHITRPGQYLTRLKGVWSRLDSALSKFVDGKLNTIIGQKVKVNINFINELINTLAIGRFSETPSTSADLIKFGGHFDFVLDIDPNDLVFSRTSLYPDPAGNPVLNWFPALGYANVLTNTTLTNAETIVYSVLPTWLRLIITALNNQQFMNRISLRDDPRGENATYLYDFLTTPGAYLPMGLSTQEPFFFWFFFAEALLEFEDRIFSSENSNCGYMRWLGAKEVFKLDSYYDTGVGLNFTSLNDAMNQVANAASIYPQASWTKPQDIPLLPLSQLNRLKEEPFDKQIFMFKTHPSGYLLDNEAPVKRILGFQPTRRDTFMRSTLGLQFYADIDSTGGNEALIQEVLDYLNNDITDFTEINNCQIGTGYLEWVRSPVTKYSQLYFRDPRGIANVPFETPILVRRTILDDTRALTGFPITQFDADTSIIGYDTNPAELLYGEDNFLFGHHMRGFMVIRHDLGKIYSESEVDDSGVNVPGVLHYRYDLCPVLVSTLNSTDSINNSVGDVYLPYASRRVGCYNQIYSTNVTNDVEILHGRLRPLDNELLRLLRVPSLYGTRRMVFSNITYPMARLVNGRPIWQVHPSLRSDGTATTTAMNNNTKLRDFFGMLYFPLSNATAIDDTTVDRGAVSSIEYYDRQMSNTFDMLASDTDEDLHALLVEGNFPFSYDIVKYGTTIGSGEQLNLQVRDFRPNSISIVKRSYDEAFIEHLDRFYIDPISSYLFIRADNMSQGIIYMNAITDFMHPDLAGKSYFNDIRQYHADHVLRFLNRDWFFYGSVGSLVKSTFSK